jgi:hypothetical protein
MLKMTWTLFCLAAAVLMVNFVGKGGANIYTSEGVTRMSVSKSASVQIWSCLTATSSQSIPIPSPIR